jgi:hypothetical protein
LVAVDFSEGIPLSRVKGECPHASRRDGFVERYHYGLLPWCHRFLGLLVSDCDPILSFSGTTAFAIRPVGASGAMRDTWPIALPYSSITAAPLLPGAQSVLTLTAQRFELLQRTRLSGCALVSNGID